MVIELISESNGPGLSLGQGHCVVFLCETLLSQCLSPARSILMVPGEFSAGGNPMMN